MLRSEHVVALLALALTVGGCGRDEADPSPSSKTASTNVLLITLDTTRADRIGCYGHREAETPNLDGLAQSGVRFEQAFCQVPLTLPSHTSLLTGTYPATNGVRINGVIPSAEGTTALAELFRAKRYRTGAFIAASVLDSGFGLARGFDRYDDDLGDPEALERRGDVVCDAALEWLATPSDKPFFAWVHFFDPHDPYRAPEPFRGRHTDPYDGEIAFTDFQVGRLVAALEDRKLRDRTLIVVVGDHGEAFREHREVHHGLFIYDTTMRVPLIFSTPGLLPAGHVVERAVALLDVFPTIVELLGWNVPSDVEGASLLPLIQTRETTTRPVYCETFYPRLGYGWAALRSLIMDDWKYIEAPRPELYHRSDDPEELANVFSENRERASRMRTQLLAMEAEMVPRSGAAAAADAATLERLAALGYVSGGGSASDTEEPGSGRDPKDMVDVYDAHRKAVGLLLNDRFDEVVEIVEPLVQQAPESDQFHVTLGRAYLELGRLREAEEAFRAGLRMVPDNPRQLWRLGETLLRQGRVEDAIPQLERSLSIAPDFAEAHCSLGDALSRRGGVAEAIRHYQRAVAASPRLARAHGRLGVAYARRTEFLPALDHLRRYVQLEPTSPHALANLGNVLLQVGKPKEATVHLRKALEHDPKYGAAHQSLFQALLATNQPGEAVRALHRARAALPSVKMLTQRLAWILATSFKDALRDPEQALQLAREGCSTETPTANGLMVLAAAYAEVGELPQAVDTAQHALAVARSQGDARLAGRLKRQLQRYEMGLPYRE